MSKDHRIHLEVLAVVNAEHLLMRLERLLKGMEEYRQHRNMTYLKGEVKRLIGDIENAKDVQRDTHRILKMVGRM